MTPKMSPKIHQQLLYNSQCRETLLAITFWFGSAVVPIVIVVVSVVPDYTNYVHDEL